MSSSDTAKPTTRRGSHTFGQELLPCPFGCSNAPYLQSVTKADMRDQFYGACVCGATGARCHRREDAIEAWNTRNTSGEDRDAALALAASIVRRRATRYSGGVGRIEPQLVTAAEEIEALRNAGGVGQAGADDLSLDRNHEQVADAANGPTSNPSEQQP